MTKYNYDSCSSQNKIQFNFFFFFSFPLESEVDGDTVIGPDGVPVLNDKEAKKAAAAAAKIAKEEEAKAASALKASEKAARAAVKAAEKQEKAAKREALIASANAAKQEKARKLEETLAAKAQKQADALATKAAKSAAAATAEERRVYATEGYYENVNGWMKFSHGTRLCTKMLTLKIQIKQLRNKITRIKESMGDSIFESFSNDNKELAEAWKSSLVVKFSTIITNQSFFNFQNFF